MLPRDSLIASAVLLCPSCKSTRRIFCHDGIPLIAAAIHDCTRSIKSHFCTTCRFFFSIFVVKCPGLPAECDIFFVKSCDISIILVTPLEGYMAFRSEIPNSMEAGAANNRSLSRWLAEGIYEHRIDCS